MSRFKRVCVYCGSSNAVAPHYKEAATAVGRTLAERGIDVVFGGGRVGLMGAVADGALAAGGRVYGVIPEKLVAHELAHPGCTELFVVDGMHPRKLMMATLSDAFIALPGGWGTMEELFEVTTWAQLNYHLKPVGLLNQGGFYDPLLAWVQRAVDEGFIRPLHQGLVSHAADIDALLAAMEAQHVPRLGEWIDRV
jgi:uncharacterized protein (TIGR00730 family)